MDIISQTTLLAILGYCGFLLKDIPKTIWDMIKAYHSISTSMLSNGDQIAFLLLNNWLTERYDVLKKHRFGSSTETGMPQEVPQGVYYIRDHFALVIVTCTLMNQTDYPYRIINITAYGYGKKKIFNSLNKKLQDESYTNMIKMKDNSCGSMYVSKKHFNDIFTKYNTQIISILDRFKRNKQMYVDHGISYKTGFLFYGPPGSGKSSMCRAIATYLGWKLLYMPANKISLSGVMQSDYKKTVIILEDIDCAVPARELEPPSKDQDDDDNIMIGNCKMTFSQRDNIRSNTGGLDLLLNFIDGPLSPNEVIFIATTNHIEKLDPALIRSGRFDHKFFIDYLDIDLAKTMCDRYKIGYDILNNIEFPCSASVIQNKIFANVIDNKSSSAFADMLDITYKSLNDTYYYK